MQILSKEYFAWGSVFFLLLHETIRVHIYISLYIANPPSTPRH